MSTEKIGEKLIELRLATRRACKCEKPDVSKGALSLKTKMLFCLQRKNLTPVELCEYISVGKTNLTQLARPMLKEGLIERNSGTYDRRNIDYSITEKGKQFLSARIDILERSFKNILTSDTQYEKAISDIDTVLELLSFL